MMGQMFSTLKRREKKEEMRGGKERGEGKGGRGEGESGGLTFFTRLYTV